MHTKANVTCCEIMRNNLINKSEFNVVAGHAIGGLSNYWGASCSRYSVDEYGIPDRYEDLIQSYEIVANRIGIIGSNTDDMAPYFGLEPKLDGAIKISAKAKEMLTRGSLFPLKLHSA